ncbi:MAG: DegT/DnrJ/EryC1/StrS family aminotransferase [Deltaproteobacteria bacterium]|nr:DegT/DnrJ/EryC1/StrS family aminotransferase [Deltaproteobacteria bacterium]MBW2299532.1 DegT/DnrJ/EryC1/StrS family aminotransferase [Deltaproteobacteria bacterium]
MRPVRPRDDFLVFGAPAIEDDEIQEVVATMKSGWLGTGPKAAQFERDFASYKGVQHAVAGNSCTAALHLSMIAADLESGDEVITTPLTFCSTINAIVHAGAKPVLADIDPLTMNIDPKQVEKHITPKTRAILPVHFAGRPCHMGALCSIAKSHSLKIIEDCAHAIETEYKGRGAGTFGDFGCFSFYVTKKVVTGEGGLATAKNEEDATRIKMLALHGMSKDAWKRFKDQGYKHYYVVQCGFKYNMMDLQAAIGIHQLKRVETNWQRRREIWQLYNNAFSDLPVGLPAPVEPDTRHAYHLYTILIDEEKTGICRDEFLNAMTAHNIGVGVHYLSIPEHTYYKETFGWKPEDYPHAMRIGRLTVSLPLSPKLTDGDVWDVVKAVKEILK